MASVDDKSVHSPGQRRKKKAIMIMLAMAWSKLEVGGRFAATKAMLDTGSQRILPFPGS